MMIEFVLCIAVASIVFETINLLGLLTTWRWKCEQRANDAEANCQWVAKLTFARMNALFAKIARKK
jgi:hypothetical protein